MFSENRRTLGMTSVVAALVAMAFAGCGGSDGDDAGSASTTAAPAATTADAPREQIGKGLTIGFVSITNCGNPTICAVQKSFAAEAKALGASAKVLEAPANASPVDAGISNLDQLVSQKVDAVAYWPADEGAMTAPTERAKKAGVPVFGYDLYNTKVGAGASVIASVNQGRELQAKQSADALCKKHPEGGEVLVGKFGVPLPSITFLLDKFKGYLNDCSGGKLKIVASFDNKTDDVSGGRAGAEPAIQAHPDVVGIESYNDATAIGAAQAAQELGKRDKVFIAGYNLAPDGVSTLENGRLDASWDYQPAIAGQLLARSMVEYLAKKETSPSAFTMVWPKCYSPKTVGDLASPDEQLAQIASGEDLAAAAGPFVQEATSIPAPSSSLPGCDG